MKQKVLYPLIKIAVVGAAFFWLSRRVDFAGVWRVILEAKRSFLALAVLLCLVPVLISGLRWRMLLGALGIHLSALRLALICQIGQFFGVLVPGMAGDDGTRLLYVSRLAPGRAAQACTTVLLDRFIGFCCLFVLSLVCIPLNWALLSSQSASRTVAVAFLIAGTCVVSACAVLLCLNPSQFEKLVGLLRNRFPGSKMVGEWAVAADIFARNKMVLIRVALAALTTQLMACANYWIVGAAVGIDAPLTLWASFVPVIMLAGVLPITFAGIGVRDYLLFLFMGAFPGGGSDSLAALSLLLLGYALFSALVGGGGYLFYRDKLPPTETLAN
jgi:uncharacterized protein (TIRG00374 family)